MADSMLSSKNCPSCGKALKVIGDKGGVALWCGDGRCGSKQANFGTVRDTEDEAYEELKKRVKDEQDATLTN